MTSWEKKGGLTLMYRGIGTHQGKGGEKGRKQEIVVESQK